MLIYKIVPKEPWSVAVEAGTFDGAPVDRTDGYIHLSSAAQVRETARLHFAGQDDLLLVAVEVERLGPALRWEPSRAGALFPHLYAPLRTVDVARVTAMPLGPEGAHVFPDDLP